MSNPVGRPTDYTEQLAAEFCERIALGNSLRRVCEAEDMPVPSTIFKWMREHDEFSKQYARACEERAESQIEELHDLGDEAVKAAKSLVGPTAGAVVSAYKIKADNIKWNASKMKPKKYGEHLDLTTNGKDLPTPILGGASVRNVHSNDSDQENTGA